METATPQPAQNAADTEKKEPRMIQIHDSIHGYISVEDRFMDIVDTPEFQRLRSIEQGSFRPVFPGARHDRFIHSLGTYHLATLFVDHFFANLKEDEKIELDDATRTKLRTTFQYAALLHDVGHAPFSHTTENLFMEKRDKNKIPEIWHQLSDEVHKFVSDQKYERFRKPAKGYVGAAHEIMSATVMLRRDDIFAGAWERSDEVDRELAARMIIGYTYDANDADDPSDSRQIEMLGIRNCLIQMLNSKIMDVDRMDYLGRDTMMSGFVNAPVDLACLGRSVTAIRENGWLVPGFRDEAINVIDTMFHAKLSHDAWVLAHPAGAYDAALREHCIRTIDRASREGGENSQKPSYIETVFSVAALENGNVQWDGKTYRLLCDADILSDLKARPGLPFDELFTRKPGHRRAPAWRTYFEFRHLFDHHPRMSADDVYAFFFELLEYLKDTHIFEFTPEVYRDIMKIVPGTPAEEYTTGRMKLAAGLLHKFLTYVQENSTKPNKPYSAVLLQRTNNYTMTIDPAQVRIRFTNNRLPANAAGVRHATFAQLRNLTRQDARSNNYFYIYRRGGFKLEHLVELRDRLLKEIAPRA